MIRKLERFYWELLLVCRLWSTAVVVGLRLLRDALKD